MLQPWQQAVGGRADHIGLRVMAVHVHKTGGDDAPRPMRHRHLRKACLQRGVRPHRLHHLQALLIGPTTSKPSSSNTAAWFGSASGEK